ncbi:carbohydrate-binding family 9-like protein [Haladaptatus pallidirubidus]|uniref:Carbohydrate-binding domain-containing protein n=1 Tax=Haladaptatus pallidirubidus TaxID=1008152 RepID=A0AAV3UJ14_9EURY|nr:carbohydrate-binding family 9-like protein [Haladaptatus pallidirubidus]
MREYIISSVDDGVQLVGEVEGTSWARANRIEVDQFNWHRDGPKPSLTARILYDDETLYLHFHVEDHRISSQVTELNGPTYLDSSVELFADPNPNEDSRYFNFEANCCGYFKLAWQEEDWQERDIGRDLVSMRVAEQIRVETSVEGSTREPRDDDTGWWLAAAIPFSVLRSLTGVDVGPTPGTVWRGNMYRSGVSSDEQKATWNPMPTEEPAYHSPEYFGRFRFD